MSSGLNWDEDYKNPFGITARAYYDDGLEATMLERGSVGPAAEGFKYLSGNTQLLGMVIEKASGKKLASYLSESFWQPLGMEQPAVWQVDEDAAPGATGTFSSTQRAHAIEEGQGQRRS